MPDARVLTSYLVLALALAAPAAIARAVASSPRHAPDRYERILVWTLLVYAGVMAARYLHALAPVVGGVDFYYYVCFARDVAAGATDVPLVRYVHFPGGVAFWRVVFELGSPSLATLQTIFIGVLVTNALLAGAIVWRVLGSPAAGVYAALWYLVVASRLEASLGTTEPIATLPILAGMLVWAGKPLRGRAGLLRAVALGAGFGGGIYVKQQAALLALGVVALFAAAVFGPRDQRPTPGALAALIGAATTIPLLGILLEGRGLEPLRIGLGMVGAYEPEGRFFDSLRAAAYTVRVFALASGLTAGGWFLHLLIPRWRSLLADSRLAVAGVGVLGGLAASYQFARRPYFHYALLLVPSCVVAVVTFARWGWQRIPDGVRSWPAATLAVAVLGGLPFVRTFGGEDALYLWPPVLDVQVPPSDQLADKPGIARDLEVVGRSVSQGDDLLVIPPRRSELHFRLGTRAISFPVGYGWLADASAFEQAFHSPGLRWVLVLKRDAINKFDRLTWVAFAGDETVARLPALGFRLAADLPTMTLWQRPR